MLSLAHAATGAFIAANVPNPWLMIPLALASHFILDHVYHFDVGTGMHEGGKKKNKIVVLALIDLILAVVFIALVWQQRCDHVNWYLWLGALIGITPDILEAPHNFLGANWKILRPLNRLHEKVHRSTASPFWGLLPQAILLCCIALLVILSR